MTGLSEGVAVEPTGALARRFPLVARPRPPCLPLTERVGELGLLADTASRTHDPTTASAVLNQAALVASDVGMPDLARGWCHQHATVRLGGFPLDSREAIHALEPVVNLARLAIRDGDGHTAWRILNGLFHAVSERADTVVDGLRIPGDLTRSDSDHRELVQWLWRTLLVDGTRALTAAGRWQDALGHLRQRNGVGMRMWDGRQVAVIASAVSGAVDHALALLARTVPGQPWENAVTAALTLACRREDPSEGEVRALLDRYEEAGWTERTAVFTTRLGLTVVDLLTGGEHRLEAAGVLTTLVSRAIDSRDGYCASEILTARPEIPRSSRDALTEVASSCGLGHGRMSPLVRRRLDSAVRAAHRVLADSPR